MRQVILSLLFLSFISCGSYAKTYRITIPTDLHGKELVLKERSRLVFKKNGCLLNGTVKGTNSSIVVKTKSPVFQDVKLEGTYTNKKAYLSWWDDGVDISDAMESLVNAFSGTVYVDKNGILTRAITVVGDKRIFIDGCGNTIQLKDVAGTALCFKNARDVELRFLGFKYVSSNPGNSSHVGVVRIAHAGQSKVHIHHVAITGFDNSRFKACGMDAIQVERCILGTETSIHDVTVNDMVVKGDGKETNGVGSNYAISVDCHDKESGKVEIRDCQISNLYNIDSNGKKIYEDTSGIYLGGATVRDAAGQMTYANWDATIHDCRFKDVSKRNIKVQGNNVHLYNLYSETTADFLKTYQNMYVGIEGNHIRVENINGQYDGSIVKITGDYLTLRNMNCTSTLRDAQYASVIRLDGTQHAVIEDCRFDNDSYMFIYPTERGFDETTEPVYHIKRCQLNVKHLLYCISNYTIIHNKGRLVVEDSEVRLSDTYCFNAKSLAEITMRGTTVNHKGKLASEKKDGGPTLTIEKSEIKRF